MDTSDFAIVIKSSSNIRVCSGKSLPGTGAKTNLKQHDRTYLHQSEASLRFALVAHMFAQNIFFVFANSSFSNLQVNANPSSANYLRLAFYWRFKPSFHLTQWEFLASAHIFSIIVNLAKIKKVFFPSAITYARSKSNI